MIESNLDYPIDQLNDPDLIANPTIRLLTARDPILIYGMLVPSKAEVFQNI